jgi:hypothetical protein
MIEPRRSAVRLLPAALLLLLLPVAGCKKNPPPAPAADATPPPAATEPTPAMTTGAPAAAPIKVVAVKLGNVIGTDKTVATEMDTFAKTDTIYAAVGTSGAGSGKLTAKWSYVARSGAEKPVSEDTQSIAPTADATTEFHISKPDGWPAGDYKIEVLLDGVSVAAKPFRVAAAAAAKKK